MRAAWYERKGAARDVVEVGEMARPEPGPGEVRVRVRASGVNPSDTKQRSGWGGDMAMPFPRVVLHQDGAGEVEAVGDGVPLTRVGERVWVYEATWGRPSGTAAGYTVVPAEKAVPLPDGVGFDAGAGLGVPAMTAHRLLFADGPVAGQTVLVAGGAGAVGLSAVQLAKWGGAGRVIATVGSPEQAGIVREAGADLAINHKDEDVPARVEEFTGAPGGRGVDRVCEVAFAANLETNLAVLKPNGVISTYEAGGAAEVRLPFYDLLLNCLTVRFVLVYAMPRAAHEQAARDINAALAAGALKPRVAKRFPLAETAAAHEAVEAGGLNGKVVVEVDA